MSYDKAEHNGCIMCNGKGVVRDIHAGGKMYCPQCEGTGNDKRN